MNVGSVLADAAMPVYTVCQVWFAMWLFARALPMRNHFAVRAAAVAFGMLVVTVVAGSIGSESEMATVGLPLMLRTELPAFVLLLAVSVPCLMLCYRASLWSALFCCSAGYALQNLWSALDGLVFAIGLQAGLDVTSQPWYTLRGVALCVLVYWLGYVWYARRVTEDGLAEASDVRMLLIMAVVLFVCIAFDLARKMLIVYGVPTPYIIVLSLMLVVSCALTLFVEFELLYNARLRERAQLAAQMLEKTRAQYQMSRENIEAINIKCHDIRYQIRHLRSGGDAVDDQVLKDIADEVKVYDSTVRTCNEALDTVLTEKSLLCERQGITLSIIADGSALAFIAPADIYALFGNALDNAMEAVKEIPERELRRIALNVHVACGMVSIHVENRFAGERSFCKGLPQTTKPDKQNHGFGMRSMQLIAARYGGTLTASAVGKVFHLNIIIPVR